MPLPALGLLGMLGRGALAGYRTLRGIRAARAAQGIPMGYQRALGTTGTGLGTGTSGTGLQGLMARGAKRFPGATGSAELGTGLLLGGEGVGDIMQGTKEGDFGQIAMGLGSLALGTPLASRGLRLTGAQRTLKSKFPATSSAMQATGKEFSKRIPKGTTAVGLGGIGTGIVLGDKPAEAEQVLGEPISFTVKDVLDSVTADKINMGKPTIIDGKQVIIGSPDYKKIAQEKLDEAYKNEEAQGTKPTATLDSIAEVFTFDNATTGGANVTNEGSLPKVNKETDLNEGEIQFLADKQEKNANKGAIIKKKMAKSQMADEFNNFYNRITELTGGNDQTSNLLLFKFATGLMSGKTAQEGVRGFLDVAGQAGSGVADTALALFAKEQDRRKDLAVAFLKAKEKQKNDGIIKADKTRQTVVVRDPNLPFGARTVEIGKDKDTGLDIMFVPTPDGSGTMAVPMKYTEYTPVKISPARLDKMRKQLSSIEQGYKFTQIVDSLPKEAFGLTAKGKLGFEKVTGAIGDVFELMGIGDIGTASANADAEIIELITADKIDDAGNIVASTEAERKETKELVDQYKKEVRSITDGAKVTDGELDNITRARLIEVRMKYILANANKSEDRLTRADVQDAEQATRIMGLFTGEKEVRSSYKNLAKDLEAQFLRLSKNYIEAGGNEEFLLSFEQMPYIRKIYADRANKTLQSNIAQNQAQILGTIE
ncbi:hypothetical protein [Hyphomonas sp.]|uniref:hypothetical protein n=1 Tax=Hyphomonas sp. TaxID=87 RepID=UPI000C9556D3|nr:hypothetical protein [Hyphomonas sp.]MAL43681.1 hypothetical protein [Hyphomonas sp.]